MSWVQCTTPIKWPHGLCKSNPRNFNCYTRGLTPSQINVKVTSALSVLLTVQIDLALLSRLSANSGSSKMLRGIKTSKQSKRLGKSSAFLEVT